MDGINPRWVACAWFLTVAVVAGVVLAPVVAWIALALFAGLTVYGIL